MLIISTLSAAAFFFLDMVYGESIQWALLHAWLFSQVVLITLGAASALTAINLFGRVFARLRRAAAFF